MKKLVLLVASALVVLSLSACPSGKKNANSGTDTVDQEQTGADNGGND